jgi:hypothetical protein
MKQDKPINSYCRQCGGDRRHIVQKTLNRHWDDEDSSIWGHDTWEILECMGCQNGSGANNQYEQTILAT